MNEWPTRVRIGVPPSSRITSGTAFEQIRLCTTVDPLAARRIRPRIAAARIAVVVEPDTGCAWSSTRKTRSASPSNASPTSASPSRTARCEVLQVLDGWIGSAGWFGNVPSSSPKSMVSSNGRPENTAGTMRPPTPLAVSATTRSGAQRVEVDERAHVRDERRQQVAALDAARVLAALEQARREHRLDLAEAGLLADRARAGAAQLDAVVLRGVVARGEHRGRRIEAPRREVAEVGGREPEVDDVGAGQGRALDERGDQRLRRRPRVAADEHPGGAGERDEGVADAAGDGLVDLVGVDAADVVGLEDRVEGGVCHGGLSDRDYGDRKSVPSSASACGCREHPRRRRRRSAVVGRTVDAPAGRRRSSLPERERQPHQTRSPTPDEAEDGPTRPSHSAVVVPYVSVTCLLVGTTTMKFGVARYGPSRPRPPSSGSTTPSRSPARRCGTRRTRCCRRSCGCSTPHGRQRLFGACRERSSWVACCQLPDRRR